MTIQIYNKDTLRFRIKYDFLGGFEIFFLVLASIFISLNLVILKCVGLLSTDLNWWVTTLPLWIGFSIVFAICYKVLVYDEMNLLFKAAVFYFIFFPPVTCTLVSCYYDKIYTGPFQYTLFPLYPIFFLAFLGYLIYTVLTIYDIIRGKLIIRVFRDCKWLNYFVCLSLFTLTTLVTFINSLSAIMLLISSYRINDTDWDKELFSVHFTPLTYFLIFLLTGTSLPAIISPMK